MRGSLIEILRQYGIITHQRTICTRFTKRLLNTPSLLVLITEATNFLRYGAPIRDRLHCILNGIQHQPVCKVCGSVLQMRVSGPFRFTFATYCGKTCIANDFVVKEKRISTTIERYGCTNPGQLK